MKVQELTKNGISEKSSELRSQPQQVGVQRRQTLYRGFLCHLVRTL